ncbi:MAG: oligosaccharide flippase family protein [Acidobacteria bacterium]|nr:oligosaccharide flippase family protein [Acidobacteriota bacterium]
MIFGVGGIVNRALGFLLLPLYLTEIRTREYGVLNLMMIVLQMVNLVLALGLGNALMRSYYDFEESERPLITATAFFFLLILCLVVLTPMFFLAPQWAALVLQDRSGRFVPHFQLLFVIAFFQILKLIPDAVLRIKMESIRYTSTVTVAFLLQLLTIIYFVKIEQIGIYGILIGTLVGSVGETLGLFYWMRYDLKWGFHWAELKRMLGFGSPLIFGRLSAMSLQSIDRFLLQIFATTPNAGQREIGLYGMANNVSGAITMLVTTPFGAVWPSMQVSVMKDPDAPEYYARILTYVLYIASVLALGAACVTGDIFRYFGSYVESASVVPMLAMAAVLDAASQVLSVGINIKRKTFVNPMIYISAALVNILLNLYFIPHHGMRGAAFTTVVGFVVLCFLRGYVSHAYLPVPYEWKRLIHLFLISIGLYWASTFIVTGRTVVDFMLHTLVALSLPLCLWLTGFHDEKEERKLREYWARFRHQPEAVDSERSSEPKASSE